MEDRPCRLTVLGSGTLLPDDRHHSAAHLLELPATSVLLDCGPGTLHGLDRFGRDWRRISHLVLSHLHTDHVGDVAALLWARRHGLQGSGRSPFTLLGPTGVKDHLEALARAHGPHVFEPGGPLDVVEMGGAGRWSDPGDRFTLFHHPTPHTDHSLAFRIEAEGVSVGYTGDTGPSPPLGAFLRGVDVLVAECAMAEGNGVPGHLTPSGAAELAGLARPGLLVLTHLYPEVDRAGLPDLVGTLGYAGRTEAPGDGFSVTLPLSPDGG